MHQLNWYAKEQERKKEHHLKNEALLVNQQLKVLLQRVQSFINRENYLQEARKQSATIVQSSVWNVIWRNNMENPEVALAQAMLLECILQRDSEVIKNGKGIQMEVRNLMRRLGNSNTGVYQDYCRQIRYLK